MPTKTSTAPRSSRRPSTRAPKMNDVMTTSNGVDHEAIAKRAFELFIERGCEHGHHEEDWLRAERELTSSHS